MFRRRWHFVSDLLDELDKPDNLFEDSPTQQVYNMISDSSGPSFDSKGRIAALSAASLFVEILFEEKNVVTPEDIAEKADKNTVSSNPATKYDIRSDILQLLYSTGMKRVDGQYIDSGRYDECEYVVVAPLLPDVDDLCADAGNPIVVTEQFIKEIVTRVLVDKVSAIDTDYADRWPELDRGEQVIYQANLIDAIDNERDEWTQLQTTGNGTRLWVNLKAVVRELATYAPKMTESEFQFLLLKALFDWSLTVPESDSVLVDGYFAMVTNWLQEEHGCGWLVIDGEKYRYTSRELYTAELDIYGKPSVTVARNLPQARPEEVKAAYDFHSANRHVMGRFYDENELGQRLAQMKSRIHADTEWSQIEKAETGVDEMETEASYKPERGPTNYTVLRQFEEELEKRKQDDEEDDPDTGSYGYQVM